MKRLIVVGGTMGVGKTTVCERLKKRLAPCVFLDGDWAWDMTPFVVTDETKKMVMDNIAHLLGNFLRCSAYENVLLCWVLHDKAILDDLLARLPLDGVQVRWFSLICSQPALTDRLMGDVARGVRAPDVIARSLGRLPLYNALPSEKLDVSLLSPDQAADALFKLL